MARRNNATFDTTIASTRVTSHKFVPKDIFDKFEIHEWRHGLTILGAAHEAEWSEILSVLGNFELTEDIILERGGNKSAISKSIDNKLYGLGWEEASFDTKIVVGDKELASPTHSVDCYKNRVALEVEWNNKDPFFDRDLNNFRLLFDLRVIDVGIIITRCDELQAVFNRLGKGASYGEATTHLRKLVPKLEGGGGGGCPVVVFGIRDTTITRNLRHG